MINLMKKAYEKLNFSHIAVNYYFPLGDELIEQGGTLLCQTTLH